MDPRRLPQLFVQFKINSSAEEFCAKAETRFLTPVLQEAYLLKYDEEPNYNKLRFLLEKELLDGNFLPDSRFSWVFDDRDLSEEIEESEESEESGQENIIIDEMEAIN